MLVLTTSAAIYDLIERYSGQLPIQALHRYAALLDTEGRRIPRWLCYGNRLFKPLDNLIETLLRCSFLIPVLQVRLTTEGEIVKIFKAVITSAAALLLASCGASPETRAESFMRALHAGHAGEAIEHLDPSVRQVGGPKLLAAMRQGHKKSQKMGGLAEAEAVETEVDGERATVSIRQTFHDSSEDTVTVKMRRVDGDWFVTF